MTRDSDNTNGRKFDVLRDSLDFRDRIYQPRLHQLARQYLPQPAYLLIRDQHQEGACTGFGLAAVIDYLNTKRCANGVIDSWQHVSTRMLYEMGRRYDRWPGEEYEGCTARGTMKGWHKHGVCPEDEWPYEPGQAGALTSKRQTAALRFPLGAYYRVLPKRSDLHAAVNEVGAVFATATVHSGWHEPVDGVIQRGELESGHAFAILGYTDEGFLIQNSWGEEWGGVTIDGARYPGMAIWTYEDFEQNLMDAWVVNMALPVESFVSLSTSDIVQRPGGPRRVEQAPLRHEISGHYIHIDDGQFDPEDLYSSDQTQVDEIIAAAMRRKHILFYAHGGLNSVKTAARRVRTWNPAFERNDIYGIHFIWETGLLAEVRDVLLGKESFARERVGGSGSWWDRVLEKMSWPLGRPLWLEMISDAQVAFEAPGSGSMAAGTATLKALIKGLAGTDCKVHLAGHSAGSVWNAHLLARWKALDGPPIDNLILFAPACTHDLFESHIRTCLAGGALKHFSNFVLDDDTEQQDTVGGIYGKSLLYMVANSFQKRRSELNGPSVPLLGLARFLDEFDSLPAGVKKKMTTYVAGRDPETNSTTHSGFGNDLVTMNSMLRLVLGDDYDEAKGFTKDELTS